jgi:hypothetical protein
MKYFNLSNGTVVDETYYKEFINPDYTPRTKSWSMSSYSSELREG